MKPLSLIGILFFLLNSLCLIGQIKHELKLDLPGAFSKNYIPHYEAVLSNRVGVEVAIGFDFSKIYLSDIDITNLITIERHEFSATHLNPSIGGKYYFSKKKYGYGLFAGPYVRWNYLLNREEGYVQKWEEIRDRPASERVLTDRGVKKINYGVHGGYKWIIKDHFLIETIATWTIDKDIGKGASTDYDILSFNSDLFIKFGYRF